MSVCVLKSIWVYFEIIYVKDAVLYELQLGSFCLPASQGMKLKTGRCGKETLPVYP